MFTITTKIQDKGNDSMGLSKKSHSFFRIEHLNSISDINPDSALGLKAKAIRRIDNDCRQVR